MARISIAGLCKSYGAQKVVSGLDLEIEDGQFVSLLGASGCGKTTTLRMLAGFVVPDAGEIRVDDHLVSSAADIVLPERRGMGMVFQGFALWPHMSVFDNVAFGLRAKSLKASAISSKVNEALHMVGLDHLAGRYPAELSGGQQQRVALARSIVVEPAVLLLDEPLSNLDAKLRDRMRSELKELQRRINITFVYVTHDQTEALALSDRIAVMHDGSLEQYGTPKEIYSEPATAYVAEFIGSTNWLIGTVQDRISDESGIVALDSGHTLSVLLPPAAVAGDKVRVSVRPEDLHINQPTASGHFNSLTGRIARTEYLGGTIHYQVSVGDMLLDTVASSGTFLSIGDAVELQVDPRRCRGMAI